MALAVVAEEWQHQPEPWPCVLPRCLGLRLSCLPRWWDVLAWAQVVSVENKITLRLYRFAGQDGLHVL